MFQSVLQRLIPLPFPDLVCREPPADLKPVPRLPSLPGFENKATNSAEVKIPIPAWMIGNKILSSLHNLLLIPFSSSAKKVF